MKTKTATPTHTPTPWRIVLAPTQIVTDGEIIATLNNAMGVEQRQGNAAFIVRAVNSHEELMEAIKVAYQFFNTEANTPDENGLVAAGNSVVRVVLRKMKQAIARAEGGK